MSRKILLPLSQRLDCLRVLLRKFKEQGLSTARVFGFNQLINEGDYICGIIDLVNDVEYLLRARLEKFLHASETHLETVYCELPEHYCELLEVIELFQFQRVLICKALDGEI